MKRESRLDNEWTTASNYSEVDLQQFHSFAVHQRLLSTLLDIVPLLK